MINLSGNLSVYFGAFVAFTFGVSNKNYHRFW